MEPGKIALLVLASVSVSAGVYTVLQLLAGDKATHRIGMASETGGHGVAAGSASIARQKLMALVCSFALLRNFGRGHKPEAQAAICGAESALRLRLMRAGWRGARATVFYAGSKTLLGLITPGLAIGVAALIAWKLNTSLAPAAVALLAAFAAGGGYALPWVVTEYTIRRRQRELSEYFPDALDLIRVCVEAGLGLDAAFARVEKEIRVSSKVLYDELHAISLEVRAGASRERALKNFALRTGLDEISALAAVLVQVERFGTSVADSLRIHSEGLRTKRRQSAEERAARVPVKLLFPMIFCIFPALIVVLLGPALIAVYRTFRPMAAG
jgi:tight adherence protein C